jgi:alanyl-tRNA synthetase
MTSFEIRRRYLEFFERQGHAIVASASLVPENDPTTLFTGSGMQPMLPYFLGDPHPLGRRVVDSQKSFRAQDIEEVGDNRHTTFFEMLGNWSFGDYFKEEQIRWMFAFLTEEIGLDPSRLYFTCYQGNDTLGIPRDTQAATLWQVLLREKGVEAHIVDDAESLGMQGGRIFHYGDKKNWWSRAGVPDNMPVGEPGGPDTEMFFDFGEHLGLHEQSEWKHEPCHVNCDCGRFVEIGNNVFMEYVKTERGFEKLPKPNVDFGGGLERLTAASMDDHDVFKSDLFEKLRVAIERLSGKVYGANPEETRAFRIVMDHVRVATFLIGDGVLPSNTDRGYVLRRVIRRAIRFADTLGVPAGGMRTLAEAVIETYAVAYPGLRAHQENIFAAIAEEEEKFRQTLQKGLKEFERCALKRVISDADVFNLFTTYGFPSEMTFEIARERGIKVVVNLSGTARGSSSALAGLDVVESVKERFEKHRELSRTASAGKFKGGLADHGEQVVKYHTATHLLQQALREVLGGHVAQKGSNITAERLRFDFSHAEKMTDDEKRRVETIVNEQIARALPVSYQDLPLDEAKQLGAIGLFEEKYGDKVRVYAIGDFSLEFCGGPHVTNTSELGTFRILKEEASSAGVRRIKAALE